MLKRENTRNEATIGIFKGLSRDGSAIIGVKAVNMVEWSRQVNSSPAGTIKPSGRCDLVPISLRILRLNSASTTLHFIWDSSQGLEAAKEFVEVVCRENNAAGGEAAYAQYAESIMQQTQASGLCTIML